MIGNLTAMTITWVRAHAGWAPLVVFALSFGESSAFVSLVLPATAILLGAGGLATASGIGFRPIWSSAALGAVIGDWASYWLGYYFKDSLAQLWPLSRHPGLLSRGQAFFDKWGVVGIFFGRFFGPLRCVMPIIAGICSMPLLSFQTANIASALVWATGVLAPGRLAVMWWL